MQFTTLFAALAVGSVAGTFIPTVASTAASGAEPFDAAPLRAIAEQYLQSYADQMVLPSSLPTRTPLAALAALPTTEQLADEIAEESRVLAERRERLQRLGVVYASAEVDATVVDVTHSVDRVVLMVREDAILPYPAGTGVDALEYTSHHDFTFVSQAGQWVLAAQTRSSRARFGLPQDTHVVSADEIALAGDQAESDAGVDGDPLNPADSAADCGVDNGCLIDDNAPSPVKFPVSLADPSHSPTPASVSASELRVTPALSSDAMGSSPTDTNIPAGLNYQKMRDYALTHARSYNTDFRSFSPTDCTNYISQIMRTGGWKHDTGWFKSNNNWWYNSVKNSFTWAGAENWSRFAPKRTEHLSRVYDMWLVDVLQIDFGRDNSMDHSMIVTGITSNELYFSYHSDDTKNRAFRSIYSEYPNAWYYAYRT